jgi:hypothetical protein
MAVTDRFYRYAKELVDTSLAHGAPHHRQRWLRLMPQALGMFERANSIKKLFRGDVKPLSARTEAVEYGRASRDLR